MLRHMHLRRALALVFAFGTVCCALSVSAPAKIKPGFPTTWRTADSVNLGVTVLTNSRVIHDVFEFRNDAGDQKAYL